MKIISYHNKIGYQVIEYWLKLQNMV